MRQETEEHKFSLRSIYWRIYASAAANLWYFRQIESWNKWRKEHPDIRPDLSEADLTGADLTKVDFSFANLNEADLTLANLAEADLSEANLFMAILVNADLHNASLISADLTSADLTAADLAKANLSRANLTTAMLAGAELVEAKLTAATLVRTELSKADLSRVDLSSANLSRSKLSRTSLINAILRNATLRMTDLSEANLNEAILIEADLTGAYLAQANLAGANLSRANLTGTDLTEANLAGANLNKASLVETNLSKTYMAGCSVYGISAWNVLMVDTDQSSLIITPPDEPSITVNNLDVAQFIYLLLNNSRFSNILDTITSKMVLILGRLTSERKVVLDAIRNELRKYDYLPILFDFEKPSNRDILETISTLAHLSRFIIADLTDPRSIPQDLQLIVPHLLIPVQPLLAYEQHAYASFSYFSKYPWVLPIHRYRNLTDLLGSLKEKVIEPAEQKVRELERWKY